MFLKKYIMNILTARIFFWTEFKTALSATSNLKEWSQLMSDATGSTDFTYQRALTSANELFAQSRFDNAGILSLASDNSKWLKRINSIFKAFNEFEDSYDVYKLTDVQVFEEFFCVYTGKLYLCAYK